MRLFSLPIASAICVTLALVAMAPGAKAVINRPTLEDSDVQKIVDAAKEALAKAKSYGCIVVADPNGMLLFLQRQDKAYPNCLSSAIAKAKTAALFETPSATYHDALLKNQLTMLAVPELDPIPGGIPLFVGKIIVGSVAISTPDGDIDITVAKAAAAAFKP
jgi:glc operon protein GlcG